MTYNATANCNSDTGIAPSHGLLGTAIVPLVAVVAFIITLTAVYLTP